MAPLPARDTPTNHPVLSVLHKRAQARTKPQEHNDGHTVALAIQGGAMRGVYSAAFLCALQNLGYGDVFDRVYGCSSGAMNAVYFLAGDINEPLMMYYDLLPRREVMDATRMFRGLDVVNIEYLFKEVVAKQQPLNYPAALNSPMELYITLADLDTLTAHTVSDFHSKEDLESALMATCWLPIAVRGTTEYRGRRTIDGGVLSKHPAQMALCDPQNTHVLALSTHSPGTPPQPRRSVQVPARMWFDRLQSGLMEEYVRNEQLYRTLKRRLQEDTHTPDPHASPHVLEIAPQPDFPLVRAYDLDREKILQGMRLAYAHAASLVLGTPQRAIPRITLTQDSQ